MQQKTIWIFFMIIGVIEIWIFSCKTRIEPVQQGTYVYINKLDAPVAFKVKSSNRNISWETNIVGGDSLIFNVRGNPGALPFSNNESENRTGDIVSIEFGNGKCTTYKKNLSSGLFDGTGVFKLSNYYNFSKELVSSKKYNLEYHISEKDVNLAQSCN